MVDKNVVYDELKNKDYQNIFFSRSYMRHEMNRIERKDHNIGSGRINKTSLSSYNDEKQILEDGYSSLSRFHKSTH